MLWRISPRPRRSKPAGFIVPAQPARACVATGRGSEKDHCTKAGFNKLNYYR